MSVLSFYLRRALKVLRERGLAGLASSFRLRLAYAFRTTLHKSLPRAYGRLIALTGNRVKLDGAVFTLNNRCIGPEFKSAFLIGEYEREERELIQQHIPLNAPIIELGGCIGVIACTLNHRLKDPDRHVVVEANPELIPTLERNRALNQARFRVLHAAIAYDTSTIGFQPHAAFTSGFVSATAQVGIEVPARPLRSIADEAGFDRYHLICDIEGAEEDLIRRELEHLAECVEWFLVEMHDSLIGDTTVAELDHLLRGRGFIRVEQRRNVVCYHNAGLPRNGSEDSVRQR